MQKNELHLTHGTISYHQYGNGPQLWLALHGFAQDGSVFAALAPYLPKDACLIALDLPWHGASDWQQDSFSITELQEAIDLLLAEKQQAKYSLIGFSFGARLALALAREEAQHWDRLVLLAPDGLPRNGWYAFFNQLPLGIKKWVARLLDQSRLLLRWANTLYDWKLLDGFSLRFMRLHLQTDASRKRLKGIWLFAATFPSIQSSCSFLAKTPAQNLLLITGERDAVIPPSSFVYLTQQITQLQWTSIAEAGHDLFHASVLPHWAPNLFKNSHPDTHPE
ncbi:MAG: alpha/beta fold hydrolase [Haliscomenobacter sp.]|uniref:alpha/beta fold hydrolase n=1 Tax=Haliscomenobacter sp. TaxID=2717303 RepID=UPI0029AA40E9|nr:alpha/beta fold hydrolase [Haliscomenobacter sp.]MDX2070567.1 alpha/beta fold hydrolase [Haliscomenobacter sp.]